MSPLICPHCRSAIVAADLAPGQPVTCPACAGAVYPPQGETGGDEPWSSAPVNMAASPWSSEPAGAAGSPWSDRPADPTAAAPLATPAESACDAAETPFQRRLARGLAGLAVFLAASIGVVLLAKQLRPLVKRPSAGPEAAAVEQWVRDLGRKEDQQEAARAVVSAGPEAMIAVLDRITVVSGSDGETFSILSGAVRAIADVGPDAAAPLGTALAAPKLNVRLAAGNILREMGPDARSARESLIAAVRDENHRVRSFAIDALGNLGPDGAPAVDALVPLVDGGDAFTRRRAIDALGHIGPAAQAAAPALAKIRDKDADKGMRQAAAAALSQINVAQTAAHAAQQADAEVRALIKKLQGENEFEGVAAAKTLGQMGARAKDAVPALALALRHKDKWRREAAANALGGLGLFVGEYAGSLRAATKDPEPEVRRAAETALEQIEGGRR
jgi:HEAT repeat protein